MEEEPAKKEVTSGQSSPRQLFSEEGELVLDDESATANTLTCIDDNTGRLFSYHLLRLCSVPYFHSV